MLSLSYSDLTIFVFCLMKKKISTPYFQLKLFSVLLEMSMMRLRTLCLYGSAQFAQRDRVPSAFFIRKYVYSRRISGVNQIFWCLWRTFVRLWMTKYTSVSVCFDLQERACDRLCWTLEFFYVIFYHEFWVFFFRGHAITITQTNSRSMFLCYFNEYIIVDFKGIDSYLVYFLSARTDLNIQYVCFDSRDISLNLCFNLREQTLIQFDSDQNQCFWFRLANSCYKHWFFVSCRGMCGWVGRPKGGCRRGRVQISFRRFSCQCSKTFPCRLWIAPLCSAFSCRYLNAIPMLLVLVVLRIRCCYFFRFFCWLCSWCHCLGRCGCAGRWIKSVTSGPRKFKARPKAKSCKLSTPLESSDITNTRKFSNNWKKKLASSPQKNKGEHDECMSSISRAHDETAEGECGTLPNIPRYVPVCILRQRYVPCQPRPRQRQRTKTNQQQ